MIERNQESVNVKFSRNRYSATIDLESGDQIRLGLGVGRQRTWQWGDRGSAVMMGGVDVDWLERESLRGIRVIEGSPSNSLHSHYHLTLIPICLLALMLI